MWNYDLDKKYLVYDGSLPIGGYDTYEEAIRAIGEEYGYDYRLASGRFTVKEF